MQDAVAEGGDLAGGQIGVAVEADQFGAGHQICCAQDDFQSGGVRVEPVARQVGQSSGLGDPGTLADAAAISSSYTSAWSPKYRGMPRPNARSIAVRFRTMLR